MITTTIAAMKPPSDQPKMATIVCSSARFQPPHKERDHEACGDPAEHAGGRSEKAINVALALGEGAGRGKLSHLVTSTA